MSSYFFLQAEKKPSNAQFIEKVSEFAKETNTLVYLVSKPLADPKYSYEYEDALIVLAPKHKIFLVDFGSGGANFENYVEDVIEDLGSISDKFNYRDIVGRPRDWRKAELVGHGTLSEYDKDVHGLFSSLRLDKQKDVRTVDLLVSLFIGSINDIQKVKRELPNTILDQVKQKIQLFDGDQTRFVYEELNQRRITIQGLSGTGKTELLLHKLKDLYLKEADTRIFFTCHNKILADNLRRRIPLFFNFMKVEQQIEWEKRLWCTHAWGSRSNPNSGAYRFITNFYDITFHRYSIKMPFNKACKLAIDEIDEKYGDQPFPKAFTYMFIDESQDFDEHFFQLCEKVTERKVFVAGDVFQSIFDDIISKSIEPDYLLGRCYRTDPKTLMFAHALGMGLFEPKKLRWLDATEWQGCGYSVDISDRMYTLRREPIRRFEDIEVDHQSIEIVDVNESFTIDVLNIIDTIRREHPSVGPEDIGIILLDQNNKMFELADLLEVEIQSRFGYKVNKAYETKRKSSDALLISNRNNVKGLEFPFVICVTRMIRGSASYRNSMYTMLSRSFIKSFLVTLGESSGITKDMRDGLAQIITENRMVIQEPSQSEKEEIQTRFEYELRRLSPYDTMVEVLGELEIDKKYHDKLFEIADRFGILNKDRDNLKEFVRDNVKYLA